MNGVKVSLLAGTALVGVIGAATVVHAADYPQPQPQIVYQPQPQVVYQPQPVPVPPPPPMPIPPEFEGWYLRGDIGIHQQKVKSLDNLLFATAPGFTFVDQPAFSSGMLFGIGVGYRFNDWMRADVTGEYRGKTAFHALDTFLNGGVVNTNDYTATKTEWLLLANVYADLGTWWCVTPFVGLGFGIADITIGNFRDNNIIAGGGGYATSASKQNFAWAVHAGLAYNVTKNFTVELAYRYLSLGDAESGDIINFDGSNTVNNPMMFKEITSHDLKLGLRWMCCETEPAPVYAQQPVYAQPLPPVYAPPPQPTYTPAPVYAPQPQYVPQPQYAPPPPVYQPPIRRKG